MTDEAQVQETSQATSSSSEFQVPEAYAGKTWAQEISKNENPSEALWKMLDNSQALIGKRVFAPPAQEAPQEEWDKFFNSMRPESPEGYQFGQVEGLPEQIDMADIQKKASQFFHKHGLTPKQADGLFKDYVLDLVEQSKGMSEKSKEQNAALDKEFDDLVNQHFGDQYEIKAKEAISFISTKMPEGLRSAFSDAENNPKMLASLVALVDVANKEIGDIKRKYGAEDTLGGGDAPASRSIDDVRRELASLRVSPEYKDFTNPKNKETVAKVNELSEIVRRSLK